MVTRPDSTGRGPATYADWKLTYADQFDRNELGPGWHVYNGPIPSTPGGRWSRDHVTVGGGHLTLSTSKVNGVWTSGGVMNSGGAQSAYGRYEVRFRMDKAPGVKYAVLLWPDSGVWPADGEIDFAEDGGGLRASTAATVIYRESDGGTGKVQKSLTVDLSTWHTMGVEWEPGRLTYTLDGAPWATVDSDHVPTKPMNLVVQTEAGSCGRWMTCTDKTTPAVTKLQVDWVALYQKG